MTVYVVTSSCWEGLCGVFSTVDKAREYIDEYLDHYGYHEAELRDWKKKFFSIVETPIDKIDFDWKFKEYDYFE